jgi:hypothetical protein
MIDDNVEKMPDVKKTKAEAGKKTEHAQTGAQEAKTSPRK